MSNNKIGVGNKLGDWTLVDHLGTGGNGVVWRAARSDGQVAALKTLKAKVSPTSKAYKRFTAEVASLHHLADEPGVLPIIDYNLPAHPTGSNPPWFAMPIATDIRTALGNGATLTDVATAICSIAQTLAALHARGFVHRDIKPGNLYRFNNAWAVGDFGLVNFPGREPLTARGEKLGPQYFLAPEMLIDPLSANNHRPADVYSLMKTFYVLATGQTWPTPGAHRVDDPATTISAYMSEPRATQLDVLLERATRTDPRERLTMTEVVDELDAWLKPHISTATPDTTTLTDLTSVFAMRRYGAEKKDEQRLANIELARASFGRFAEYVQGLQAELGLVVSQQELLGFHVLFNNQIQGTVIPRVLVRPWAELHESQMWVNFVFTSVQLSTDPRTLRLYSGVIVQLLPEERILFTAGHFTARQHAFAQLLWLESKEAPLGSAVQMNVEAELEHNLRQAMESALNTFLKSSDHA